MEIHKSDSFKNSKKQAADVMDNPSKTQDLIKKVLSTSNKNKGFFDVIWDDLQTLIKMVRSWNRGEYRQVGQKSMLIVIAGLIYFISPIDAIPDLIPFLGWADDLTLLGYVIKTLKGEIDKYRAWEKVNNPESDFINLEFVDAKEV